MAFAAFDVLEARRREPLARSIQYPPTFTPCTRSTPLKSEGSATESSQEYDRLALRDVSLGALSVASPADTR
jgi:hypothetical protein